MCFFSIIFPVLIVMRTLQSRQRRPTTINLQLTTALWLILLITSFDNSHGSRNTAHFFRFHPTKPSRSYRGGHFFGFFPKSVKRVPASGPSKRHNGVDLQDWKSP